MARGTPSLLKSRGSTQSPVYASGSKRKAMVWLLVLDAYNLIVTSAEEMVLSVVVMLHASDVYSDVLEGKKS